MRKGRVAVAPDVLEKLQSIESYLACGQTAEARPLLEALLAQVELYIDEVCVTSDTRQYFSFSSQFEKLAYQRVEKDPRELVVVEAPFDRVYADYAFCLLALNDPEAAAEALKKAVRWNPMDCAHRLNLADLFRTNGDIDEWLGLSFSVFERASDARHLVRAYLNFAQFFSQTDRPKQQAACLRCARRLEMPSAALEDAIAAVAGGDADPDSITDEQARDLLAQEGLPEGANAEIAVCMLMCASDAAKTGHRDLATDLTVRARDLVGGPAATALIELIHNTDEAADDAQA